MSTWLAGLEGLNNLSYFAIICWYIYKKIWFIVIVIERYYTIDRVKWPVFVVTNKRRGLSFPQLHLHNWGNLALGITKLLFELKSQDVLFRVRPRRARSDGVITFLDCLSVRDRRCPSVRPLVSIRQDLNYAIQEKSVDDFFFFFFCLGGGGVHTWARDGTWDVDDLIWTNMPKVTELWLNITFSNHNFDQKH